MGSRSDLEQLQSARELLTSYAIPHDVRVLSAHRNPEQLACFIREAEGRGTRVFIAAAGGAAHLAGVIAAHTTLPVLGVPMTSSLLGLDSLLSIVQMPRGVPVATFAIGKAGAANAAIFAVQILAASDAKLRSELKRTRVEHANALAAASRIA